MCVVTIDARLLHDAGLGVTNDGLAVDLSKFMGCLSPLTLPQAPQRLALEVIVGSSVAPPRKRSVAVLPHANAGFAVLVKLFTDVVQKRGRNAERNGVWR